MGWNVVQRLPFCTCKFNWNLNWVPLESVEAFVEHICWFKILPEWQNKRKKSEFEPSPVYHAVFINDSITARHFSVYGTSLYWQVISLPSVTHEQSDKRKSNWTSDRMPPASLHAVIAGRDWRLPLRTLSPTRYISMHLCVPGRLADKIIAERL